MSRTEDGATFAATENYPGGACRHPGKSRRVVATDNLEVRAHASE